MKPLLLLSILICAALPLRAADIPWDGGGDGATWSDAANWAGDVVPGGGDHAIITQAGTYTVRLTANASVGRVTIGGASGTQTLDGTGFRLTLETGPNVIDANGVLALGGAPDPGWNVLIMRGALQIRGRLDWAGGSIDAETYGQPPAGRVITIEPAGTMRWVGPAARQISATIDNRGTIRWEEGTTLYLQGYAHSSSGTFDIALTAPATFARTGVNSVGPWIFVNTGTIIKTGSDTAMIQVQMHTIGGMVDVREGVYIQNYTSRWENATISVAAGTTLQLAANRSHEPHTVAGTLTGAPLGNFLLSGLPGAFYTSIMADTAAGGRLEIGGTGLQVGYASLGGFHDIKRVDAPTNAGLMRLVGDRDHRIYGGFVNEDTLRWEQGRFYYMNTGAFTNNGLFEMALVADDVFETSGVNYSRPGPFYNYGTVRKTGPATATSTVDFFTIGGHVEVLDGKLFQHDKSRWENATFSVTEGDTLQLAGNRFATPHVIAGTLSGQPAGTFLLATPGYHCTIVADSNGGALDIGGTGLQADNAEFGVRDNWIFFPAPVNRNLVRFVGNADKQIDGPFRNEGTLRWENGRIYIRATTFTTVGLFEMMPGADQEIQDYSGVISLGGTMRKSDTSDVMVRTAMISDSATVEVLDGEVAQVGAGYWKDLNLRVDSGATFALNSNRDLETQTVAGTIRGTIDGTFRIGGRHAYHTNLYADSIIGGRLEIGGTGLQLVNAQLGGFDAGKLFPSPVNIGYVRFTGNDDKFVNAPFRNEGTMEWDDGNIHVRAGVSVTNAGLFDISAFGHTLNGSNGGVTIVNEANGLIRKIDSGETTLFSSVDNSGRLALLGGILNVPRTGHFNNLAGGTISGAATLDLRQHIADSLLNTGLTSPGTGDAGEGIGTLRIRGLFPHTRFRFDLAGVDSAEYDRLILTESTPEIGRVIADVVVASGLIPKSGDVFDVVNGAVTGRLDSVIITPSSVRLYDLYPPDIVRLSFDRALAGEPVIYVNAPVIAARQGETIDLPITVVASEATRGVGVTEVTVDLRFDATLLVPIDATPKGVASAGERRISLRIPISPTQDTTRALFRFRATLGDDSMTVLELEDPLANVAAIAVLDSNGTFRLLDLCYEGGARLLNPSGSVAVTKLAPNPASNRLGIDLTILEKGATRIMLVDASGRFLRTLHEGVIAPGDHHLDIDIGALSSGRYYITVETPTVRISRPVEVIR